MMCIDVHCSNGAKNYKFSFTATAMSMILRFEELKYSNIAPLLWVLLENYL